jgi:hypothetical protein
MHVECDLHRLQRRARARERYHVSVTRSLQVVVPLLLVLFGIASLSALPGQRVAPVPSDPATQSATTKESAAEDPATDVTYGQPSKVAAKLFQRPWDPQDPRPTCKVFHQIYAADGTLLTKALGGTFEHHRGLFVGWNRTKFEDKLYDFWHLHKGESQRYRGPAKPALLNMGKQAKVSSIEWLTPDDEVVIRELRGLEVRESNDDSYVLHMRVQCSTNEHDVQLGGDPQHAGQQFRALQQFAEEGAKPVAYVRPKAAKKHDNDVWTDCEWTACVMELPQGTYTVLRVEGPNNPGKTTWSTRPYGRFGATRTVTVSKDKPLRIDQFYVVANGARDAQWCAAQAEKWRAQPNESQTTKKANQPR